LVEFAVLALLAIVGLSVAAVIGFVFFLLKFVFWVVFLPLRLLFKLM
jgi:predicted membrane metal-binding protein